jgi:ABC-2 type transport system permease protein
MPSLSDSMLRIRALSIMDLRRLRADPGQCYVLIVLPLMMVLAITPMALAMLRLQGFSSATGAEQSVPGMAALFSFMSTMLLGASFFKEHDWHTWDRLRASPALAIEIVVGKCLPVFGVSLLQLAVIWGIGLGFYKLKVHGPLLAIAAITICLSWATLGLGMALVSLCRTIDQLGILANMGSLVLGGLSGAFAPLNLHTLWGRLAQFSPLYWALHAYQQVIFDGSGIGGITLPCLLLLTFGLTGFAIAAVKFRMAEVKIGRS